MAEVIRMPRMSDTMTEGVIVAWHKKVGDRVEPGDLLAEVETDKATMELESYQQGTLLYIGVEKGAAVPVEGIIAILGEKGEDYKQLLGAVPAAPAKTAAAASSAASPATPPAATAVAPAPAIPAPPPAGENGRTKASPLAKKMAKEMGIDIGAVKGTGDSGRIVRRDIESFQPGAFLQAAAFSGKESFSEKPVSQMRKAIARRLTGSKFTAPHFYLTMEINMDKAAEARKSMNEISPVKISFNDMIIKAAAASLRLHPQVNASWAGAAGQEVIRYANHVHIGVAVAVEEGLVVPVIRFADTKTLSQIASESRQNAEKAVAKKLQLPEMEGSTFTVSNLGMFDIDEFTAIINSPDACILAVGKIKQTPAVINGEIKPANLMKVTLSCDHRVVDGATGARFLKSIKTFLEDPVLLLV